MSKLYISPKEGLQKGFIPYHKKFEIQGECVRIQQVQGAFEVFERFFELEKFDTVIEIGTGYGGLSMFLHMQSKIHNFEFVTYDIDLNNRVQNLIELHDGDLPFDFRCEDCFAEKTISDIEEMLSKNKVLLLCDGGEKAKEINTFANYLQPGSFIMGHDYSPNEDFFNENIKDKVWRSFELQDSQLFEVAWEQGLIKSKYYNDFLNVVWLCLKKVDEEFHESIKLMTFSSVMIA